MRISAADFRKRLIKKPSKFGNERIELDGIVFASKAEAKRYAELKALERAGEIAELELQPKFKLTVNGVEVCTYIGDFRYRHVATKKLVTEDVKGFETKDFKLKAKLFKAVFGHDIVLVKS
jgi:hypothetical protein